jgi:hypothetical protein
MYDADKIRIIVTQSGIVSTARWKVETRLGGAELDSGEAGSYKLACAAAGEAFQRLTASKVEEPKAFQWPDGNASIGAEGPDIMQRMAEAQRKVCGPDWKAEAQRATQQYINLLAAVNAARAEIDARAQIRGLSCTEADRIFDKHLDPIIHPKPPEVRALQEALRAYREVSHDRVNGDDVKAMAAAIAAYETEKAKA